jgi:phosphoribosylglycinamide formyltransferase-1
MRIGVLGSSGGSAFGAFHDILTAARSGRFTFVAASDRACGFETVCAERRIPCARLSGRTSEAITEAAVKVFAGPGGEPDVVLLYFLRIVTAELFERYPCFNIHPSLLPAFPGLDAVSRARERGVRFLGATLHQVDAQLDGGPIVAQMVMPVPPGADLGRLEKFSFLQKVYCSLLLVDLLQREQLRIERGRAVVAGEPPGTDRCNPALESGPLLDGFRALQRREGAEVVP